MTRRRKAPDTGANDERYLLISADCHAAPRPQDSRSYLDPEWREAFDAWLADDAGRQRRMEEHIGGMLFADETLGEFEDKEKVAEGGRDGGWDSARRLRELDADGVVGEVIFPNDEVNPLPFDVGLMTYQYQQEPARWLAGCRAYNRWLADFCNDAPGRRAGVGLITVDDIDTTVKEVEWLREHGVFGGILLPGGTGGNPYYNHPRYESLWAACEDLDMPVHTHSGWTPNYGNFSGSIGIYLYEITWWAHRPFWLLIWSGVFERHPRLRFVMSEQKADWMIPALELLDSRHQMPMFRQLRKELPLKPSEYFRRQCFLGASFMDEGEWDTRRELGIDKLMWGSDYPHLEGCWPHTLETLQHIFDGVPSRDVARMIGYNTAEVYGFDVDALLPLAAELGPPLERIGQPGESPASAGRIS